MWSITEILLLLICIFSAVKLLTHGFDIYLRYSWMNAQAEQQRIATEEAEKEFEALQKQQDFPSEEMSRRGSIGAATNQKKMVERKFYEGIMEQPEVSVALEGLKFVNEDLYNSVKKNPRLIPHALELLKKWGGNGNSAGMTTVSNNNRNSSRSSGW